ncbi:PTS transporter subunit IIC [Peribacillus loiseleuriae]|uniref:PTS galactitol transporter subunit IIC n=1 Tax=Peribacillus loiseleuriae TaxID=1679170 RepID=A0A0K9GTH6_9BACI|nr:PTS transporter subunit IIC [Peribacillus loiseleuriae]KMY49974.1 PTS galactitol transporter subunit IIC [Peribacillus loiseleuriae]
MHIMESALNWFFGLGGTVFVPIIIFVLALSFRIKFSTSLRSAIYMGIGLTALNLVIDLSVTAMAPVTEGLSKRLHADYSVIDIGYGNVSIAWTWPGVIGVIIGILVINLIFVFLKLTKTLWVDMWNIWHGQAVAALMWALTGSITVGIATGLIFLIVNMFLADYHAKKFQEFNEIPGVTIVATSGTYTATFAMFVMKIIDRIPGLRDLEASPDAIKNRFGIFGEISVVGAIMGIIMGVLAGSSVPTILNLSITLATVLVILPKMLSIIAEGIIPISTGVSKFMRARFPGRDLHIAVDPAVLLGHPSVMSTVILMYPISIFIAAILPGGNFIPVASLAVLPYWVGGMVPYTRGNVIHTVIVAILWIIPTTLISSELASLTTEASRLTGLFTEQISQGARYTNWEESGNILLWFFVKIGNLFGFKG